MMMSLCKICGKPATGGVNAAASAASSVPSRFELRCQDHLPQFTMTATPPPGGQPQALTAEREADLRADHQCSDVDTWCRAAGCKQDWPCATAQLLAALDEARSEVMRLQDNDSAYDVGYQRADAAAGAAIERLRALTDDERAGWNAKCDSMTS